MQSCKDCHGCLKDYWLRYWFVVFFLVLIDTVLIKIGWSKLEKQLIYKESQIKQNNKTHNKNIYLIRSKAVV